ncbi:MAG TPA: hypothetical protein VN841_07180 [Bryobacteraceae bacterium]|nr:hypothetical protein [Bryobacteraceae bacterium]
MPHGFSIELLNLRLGFSASSGPAAALIERYVFPTLPRKPPRPEDLSFGLESDGSGFRIDREGAEYATAAGADEALVSLQQAVDEHVVQHAAGFAFVHAGAVGVGGAAALLIASSGHGKSTLVKELAGGAWGADYYSDEYAAIDPEGRLHPYPRSLLLREGRPAQHPVTPQELGARVAAGPAEIRLVLQVPYAPDEGHIGIRVTPLAQSEALHLLLKSTPQALDYHPAIFGSLTKVAARARTYTGVRGESPKAARAILELLSE